MLLKSDIDIDVFDRGPALHHLSGWVRAAQKNKTGLEYHKTGLYFQNVPRSQVENKCSFDYKEAEEKGYFKIDILNNSLYQNVLDEEHLNRLSQKEPNWKKLEDIDFVRELFQLANTAELVVKKAPKSVNELAMMIALIRPAKRYLAGQTWDIIEKKIWEKEPNEEYHFKKSHAFAYAIAIVVQMNLRDR